MNANRLEIFVDSLLMEELARVLTYPKIKNLLPLDTIFYIDFVRLISTNIVSNTHRVKCPDPDDDYLFDIALTAHTKLLITGEKALLNWVESPVEVMSLSKFRVLF